MRGGKAKSNQPFACSRILSPLPFVFLCSFLVFSFFFLQLVLNIESQAAIDNLENMLAPELGVDAVIIGPHDLSCNLGVPEQYVP